jgi:hypothetical protein
VKEDEKGENELKMNEHLWMNDFAEKFHIFVTLDDEG